MSNETATPPSGPDRASAAEPKRLPLSALETDQPDPMLQLTTGRMGGGGITLVALIIVVIVGVVFWGLNSRTPVEQTAAAPSVAHGVNPAAGGKSGAPALTAPRPNTGGVKG